MKVRTAKVLRDVAKVALLLCIFLLLGLGIYYTYLSIRFRPYKVRVSNVTDSAFTVSWVTDEPMVGVVYYGEKDSFLPGPLSWLGKKRAFDDRDVSDAQTECVSKFNKKVSKNRDENFTVDASGFDCNEVKVIKKGQYYTHHVTVPNLDADKEYYFRVGNGYISFKEGKTKGIEYIEREMPAVAEFKQKTLPIITEVGKPAPAYGTSFNFYRKSDGFIGMKKNFDSIIFLKTFKEGTEYPLMSAVTNSDGGWSIDLSNVRDKNNNVLALEGSSFEFIPQVDNARPGANGVTKYEDVKFPLRILGNDSDDWGESKSSSLDDSIEGRELGALLKGLVAGVGAYNYDDEDRIECWRIGDCQYKVFNTGACPSGYTNIKANCRTETPPPTVNNPWCCTSNCICKNDWVTCPGAYKDYGSTTKSGSIAACKAAQEKPKVSCCVQLGESDCQCVTNRDAGSCGGSYPKEYNTNNKADAIAKCKADLPQVENNCYRYIASSNTCEGGQACRGVNTSKEECEKKVKEQEEKGKKTCCKINIEGGCSCLYDQEKCTGLYREYSSRDDCKNAQVTVIGDPITTVDGCVDGRTPPTYVPVRVTGIANQSIAQKKGILDILRSKVFAQPMGGEWESVCQLEGSSACYTYYDYDGECECTDCQGDECNLCKQDSTCEEEEMLCPKEKAQAVDDSFASNCTAEDVLRDKNKESGCKEYWRHTDCAVVYSNSEPGDGYTSVRKDCRGSNLSLADNAQNSHLLSNHCIVKIGDDKYDTAPNMTRTIVSGGCNSCYAEYVNKYTGEYCGNVRITGVFCGNPLGEAGCENQRVSVIGCGEECNTDECVCASNCENGGVGIQKGGSCESVAEVPSGCYYLHYNKCSENNAVPMEDCIGSKGYFPNDPTCNNWDTYKDEGWKILEVGKTCPLENNGLCKCFGSHHPWDNVNCTNSKVQLKLGQSFDYEDCREVVCTSDNGCLCPQECLRGKEVANGESCVEAVFYCSIREDNLGGRPGESAEEALTMLAEEDRVECPSEGSFDYSSPTNKGGCIATEGAMCPIDSGSFENSTSCMCDGKMLKYITVHIDAKGTNEAVCYDEETRKYYIPGTGGQGLCNERSFETGPTKLNNEFVLFSPASSGSGTLDSYNCCNFGEGGNYKLGLVPKDTNLECSVWDNTNKKYIEGQSVPTDFCKPFFKKKVICGAYNESSGSLTTTTYYVPSDSAFECKERGMVEVGDTELGTARRNLWVAMSQDGKTRNFKCCCKGGENSGDKCEWQELGYAGWCKNTYNASDREYCDEEAIVLGASTSNIPDTSVLGVTDDGTSPILYLPESGTYTIEGTKGTIQMFNSGDTATFFFDDRNGIPGYQMSQDPNNPQSNEDILVHQSSVVLNITQNTSAKQYNLKKGINIISFDFFPSEGEQTQLMSNRFLELVNQSGYKVSRISYFGAGQWDGGNTYDFETREVKGAPFALSQGKGYVIVAERDTTITVPGYKTNTPIPIAFSSGWNLIGVHGHDTQYTAKSLINSVNSIEGLKANNVTYWPTSKGMYQGFQLSEGQEYGQDFPISKDLGYFVRINEIKEDCRSIWWNPDGEDNGKCNTQ